MEKDLLIQLLVALIVFALGASFGSFVNVVVYRLPAGLSILWPPSRCPHCLRQLGKRENVPVLGWLWLRGRCRHCRSRISGRYPVVEALTGILFLLVFWTFGVSVQTLSYWAFCSWLLTLSLIDLDTMTLPNQLTQSGLVVGLGFQFIGGSLTQESSGSSGINQLMVGIIGAVLGLWLLDLITIAGSMLFRQAAMGEGDAKLVAMMGAWLGWKYLLLAGFLGCIVGVVVGGGAIVLGLQQRRQPMPFGPSLAVGGVMTVFGGEMLLSSYIQFVEMLSSQF